MESGANPGSPVVEVLALSFVDETPELKLYSNWAMMMALQYPRVQTREEGEGGGFKIPVEALKRCSRAIIHLAPQVTEGSFLSGIDPALSAQMKKQISLIVNDASILFTAVIDM